MKIFMLCPLLLTLLISLVALVAGDDEPPSSADFLYAEPDENEPVREFLSNEGDFRESTKPKLVEFYNPYCGACQSYRPEYLKLAKELEREMGDELEIYAVSCEVHKAVCDAYDVDSIPLVGLSRFGNPDPHRIRKLKSQEKNSEFIISYLFPDHGSRIKRGLEEEDEDESGEGNGNENEGDENDDNNEGEEERENGNERGEEEVEMDFVNGDKNEGEEDDDGGQDNNENPEDNEAQENQSEEENDDRDNEEFLEGDSDEAHQQQGDSDEEDDDRDSEEFQMEQDAEEANRDWLATDKFPDLPRPPGSLGNRRPESSVAKGAGAMMKEDMASDMDRFKFAFKNVQGARKSFFRREEPLVADVQRFKAENMDLVSGASSTMKAHQPGTVEYQLRQQKLQAHMDGVLKKKKLRTTSPARRVVSAGAGGASRIDLPANHKPVMPYKKEVRKQKFTHKVAGKVPIIKRLVKMSKEEELILDASLSFLMALKSGLFNNADPLSKSKKHAFQTWLDLLRVSLPPEWGLHEVIMDLDNNMDYAAQSEVALLKILSRHELPRQEWSNSCTVNGRQHAFNCGFWKLLHIISVGVAEHRGGLNLVEGHLVSKDARIFSPDEAAEAMKDFIGNFFPCTECRNHFVAQYDECSNRRCIRLTDETEDAPFADWQELAKWLWEVHNEVSVRLFKQRNRKQKPHDEIKVLYPSLETCISCFDAEGGFNQDAIFLFLEREYWPGASEIDPTADKLLTFHNAEYSGFASSWALLFLAIGLVYMIRPRGVFEGQQKKRSD